MTKEITLTIDNHQVTVPEGTLVVDAAKKIGIDIPVFCYHPKMDPVGMCRMCLVEIGRPQFDRGTGNPVLDENGDPVIQFGPNLETGCTVAVSEGMVVRGDTNKVDVGRDNILEFILTSHPLDCPICDKGGECPLQNLTMSYGPGESRFLLDEKIHLAKKVPLGELIYLDRERCIQCARCTRFQDEIVDDPVIGFYQRGRSLEIVTYTKPGFDSYWSGNTSDICPVGALTTADFRFGARPWELNAAASICNQCAVGCNLTLNTRREAKSRGEFVIKRVMPRQNEQVNEIWICDKGRFSAYHFSEHPDRLTEPLIRKNGELVPASWGEALDLVSEKFSASRGDLLTLVGGRLSNEDLFNIKSLTEGLEGQAALYTHVAGGDRVAEVGVGLGTNLSDLGQGDAILVIASDLEEEAPIWWLRVKQAAERGASVFVANPRATRLDRCATRVLRYQYGQELAMFDELPAEFVKADNAIVFFGSEGLGLEASQALADACTRLLIETGHAGKINNGLIAVHPRPNDQGAWDLGFRPDPTLAQKIQNCQALYIAAADPAEQTELRAALSGDIFVVIQDLFLTETARLADVVLPVQAFVERDGTYTSGERRVQRFYQAVPGPTGVRADFTIAAQIASRLDLELEGRLVGKVFAQLAERVQDYSELSFIRLAQTVDQWPIVGRGDMFYGGTSYENSQGLGVQLSPATERGVEIEPPEARPAPSFRKPESSLVAVPVNRLYDQGAITSRSRTLSSRLAVISIGINPEDAVELGLEENEPALINLNGSSHTVRIRIDRSLQKGVCTVPRSSGMEIEKPTSITITAAEPAAV